jgi:hypothetical protein
VSWVLNSTGTIAQTSLTSNITKIQLRITSDWRIELKDLIPVEQLFFC